MTMARDTLPALSGICKEYQAVKNCKYLAGIWEDELVLDLC